MSETKERLEELRSTIYSEFGYYLAEKNAKWLFEQAERVEELEKQLDKIDDEYQKDIANAEGAKRSYKKQRDSLKEENAKLSEALKFYADEISYKDYDEWSPGTSDVMSDYGRKARTALERESK